jgi:Ssp1 endopeptidase immunity protein Rap1a
LLIAFTLFGTFGAAEENGGLSMPFKDGNELYQECTAGPSRLFCIGYIEGVADALSRMHLQCLPEQVAARQIVELAVNYLRDHPEKRHLVASDEVGLALVQAFPCKEQAH